MYNWYNDQTNRFSSMLCEDVCAPELRNPNHSGMRGIGWLRNHRTIRQRAWRRLFRQLHPAIFLTYRQ